MSVFSDYEAKALGKDILSSYLPTTRSKFTSIIARKCFQGDGKSAATFLETTLREGFWRASDPNIEHGPSSLEKLRQRLETFSASDITPDKASRLLVCRELLRWDPSASSVSILQSIRSAYCAIAVRSQTDQPIPPSDRHSALVRSAAYILAQHLLRQRIPEVNGSTFQSGISAALAKDLALACCNCSGMTLEEAFKSVTERHFNHFFTGNTESQWNQLTSILLGEAMLLKRISAPTNDLVHDVHEAIRELSSRTLSRWVLVSDLHESFDPTRAMSLQSFKRLLIDLMRQSQIEFGPLVVSASTSSEKKERSEVIVGGQTYHYVRIPQRAV